MSLAIALWDEFTGIAVSEGRACTKGSTGELIPVREDVCKLHRLPDGSLLGIAGRMGVCAELRGDIESEARTHGFAELRASIVPPLMTKYRALHSEATFSVLLMGREGEKVCCSAWGSNEPDPSVSWVPSKTGGVNAAVLGFKESGDAALRAVKSYLNSVRIISPQAVPVLEGIFSELARQYVEVNERLTFEFVLSSGLIMPPLKRGVEGAMVEAIGDGSGRFAAGEAGADMTALHCLTSSVVASSSTTLILPATDYAVSGLAWTAQAAGSGDVFNINGIVTAKAPAGSGTASIVFRLYVDGVVVAVGAGGGNIWIKQDSSADTENTGAIFFSVTGLPLGNHHLEIHASTNIGSCQILSGSAICQRIY